MSDWVVKPKPNPGAQLKLFCLPFAGGGSTSFRPWAELLPAQIELCAVEIPGRGHRLREPLVRRMEALIPQIANGIKTELDRPFVLFGHSMGTLLVHELTHYLLDNGLPAPAHLFVSGRGAPHLPSRDKPIHQLPEKEFVAEIRKFDGTPKEVLEHEELMELMIPILRADFEVCETYRHSPKPPVPIPITVFGGLQDEGANREELEAWQELTSAGFKLHMFPGGHFFLLRHHPTMVEIIVRDVQNQLAINHFNL